MAHWKLKIEKQFADEIESGMKNFEIRCENDKVFQKGDSVEFLVNPTEIHAAGPSGAHYMIGKEIYAAGPGGDYFVIGDDHPINGRIYDITYVLHGWGLREDYCAFAIKERVNEETVVPKEDIILLPPEMGIKEFRSSVIKDIRKMCAERPNCAGCIFNEDIYEYTCMLKGIPGDWKI